MDAISIVGARNASATGTKLARRLAEEIGGHGDGLPAGVGELDDRAARLDARESPLEETGDQRAGLRGGRPRQREADQGAGARVVPDQGVLGPQGSRQVYLYLDIAKLNLGTYRNDLRLVNAYNESLPADQTGTTQRVVRVKINPPITGGPTITAASSPAPGVVRVDWSFSPGSLPLHGYQIYRSSNPSDPASWVAHQNVPGIQTTRADLTGFSGGSTLYLKMDAYGDGIRSNASNVVAVTVQGSAVPQGSGRLNDTGQTWGGDYPSGNNATCTSNIAAPQDCHQGRDATSNNDADGHAGFSFTKLDGNGNPLPASAQSWSCVRDNVTGLTWEVKASPGNGISGDEGLHDADDRFTWYNTNPATNGGAVGYDNYSGNICYGYDPNNPSSYCNTQAYVARVNAQGRCGARDWRMPKREELRSLVDYSRYDLAIDTNFFPGNTWWFWSSSAVAYYSDNAWIVNFSNGLDSNDYRSNSHAVRMVRGGQ